MTNYYMVRSFDHAGYYETRLIMMLVAFGIAFYALRRNRDSRYLVVLISGVLFQGLMEYILQAMGLRGVRLSLFRFRHQHVRCRSESVPRLGGRWRSSA